jgi:DNA-binding SARP family transcriptional activator
MTAKRKEQKPAAAGAPRHALAAMTARIASSRIIFAHPDCHNRMLLLAELMRNPPCDLFYYDLGAEDTNLVQFLSGLTHSLSRQVASFKSGAHEALAAGDTDPAALAEAFAHDLGQLSSKDYLLILDEVDRADKLSDVQAFFESLINVLPPKCHLWFSSRALPRLSWTGMVASGQAMVLQDTRILPEGYYSETLDEHPTLEASALGPGYVLLNGRLVDTWQGHLQQAMFFYMLDRPRFTRLEICQALWPDLSADQAVNVFHVTKRRLHSAFGFDVLVFDGLHYQITPQVKLHYDVLEFVDSLVEARATSGAESIEHWQRAINLYRGAYLQGYPEPWVLTRQEDFRKGYIEALQAMAHIHSDQGEDEKALGFLVRALGEAYHREDLHREVIRLYGKLGQPDQAELHYERLVHGLRERYDFEPSPETRAVYQEAVG